MEINHPNCETATSNDFSVVEEKLDAEQLRRQIDELQQRIRDLEEKLSVASTTPATTQRSKTNTQPQTTTNNSTVNNSTTNNTVNNETTEEQAGLCTVPVLNLIPTLLRGC